MNAVLSRDFKDLDFINSVRYIDKRVYPESLCGTYELAVGRYLSNKDSYIFIRNSKNIIVGYICFFPICDAMYNEMFTNGIMRDDDIKPTEVLEYSESNNIFIISVAILPEYQNKSAVVLLIETFKRFIKEKSLGNHKILSLSAIAVSSDGEKFLSRLKFNVIKRTDNGYALMKKEGCI